VSWYEKILRKRSHARDATRLLKLRCTRFRQLLRNYGKILDAIADAAEKQGGEYIFDRQYVVSLAEVVIDLADAVVFDLNVLADQRYQAFYGALDRFRRETREVIAPERHPGGQSDEEETEYRILRALRRSMLSLSLEGGRGPGAVLDDCTTIHDLAHLAHELAGDTQLALVTRHGDLNRESAEFVIGVEMPLRVVDVGDGLAPADPGADAHGVIRSVPLRALVDGMDQIFRQRAASWHRVAPASVSAVVTEDQAHVMIHQPGGFDMVDASTIGSKESNHLYCRFASAVRGGNEEIVRGAVAREILARLGFAATRTARSAAALLRRVPRADAEERLTIVGRLVAFVLARDAAGWDAASSDAYVNAFMAQHT
jgi:hypothetical protein